MKIVKVVCRGYIEIAGILWNQTEKSKYNPKVYACSNWEGELFVLSQIKQVKLAAEIIPERM